MPRAVPYVVVSGLCAIHAEIRSSAQSKATRLVEAAAADERSEEIYRSTALPASAA